MHLQNIKVKDQLSSDIINLVTRGPSYRRQVVHPRKPNTEKRSLKHACSGLSKKEDNSDLSGVTMQCKVLYWSSLSYAQHFSFQMTKPQIEVMLIGNSEVGKTCLVLTHQSGKYPSHLSFPPIAADPVESDYVVDGRAMTATFWDMGGSLCVCQQYYPLCMP